MTMNECDISQLFSAVKETTLSPETFSSKVSKSGFTETSQFLLRFFMQFNVKIQEN